MDDDVEMEGRPRQPLMLKEWLELESSAELSRDGFGCYPRHLAAEFRSTSGRRRNGDVIARFSAAVRAALSRPPAGREGEAAALSRSLSRRLRAGFRRKRRGEAEETDRPVASGCSPTAGSSGRRDAPSTTSPAMSPRRMSWEGRQAGGDGTGLSGGRRSHDTVVEGCDCETACHLDEEREQEQRLSPVSVMDFHSQDGDDGNGDDCNDNGGGNDHGEEDGASPTFEQSLANIRRASQQLLQRIRRFEQLAEIDASDDVDDATTTTTTTAEDPASCHVEELDNPAEDGEGRHAQDPVLSLPEAGSPCAPAAAPHCFKKLLQDFFREGLSSSCQDDGRTADDPELEGSLLEKAKAWLDGRHRALRLVDGKAEVEEVERLGRWFREDERELLGCDVEGGIFWSLMEELVDDLC